MQSDQCGRRPEQPAKQTNKRTKKTCKQTLVDYTNQRTLFRNNTFGANNVALGTQALLNNTTDPDPGFKIPDQDLRKNPDWDRRHCLQEQLKQLLTKILFQFKLSDKLGVILSYAF